MIFILIYLGIVHAAPKIFREIESSSDLSGILFSKTFVQWKTTLAHIGKLLGQDPSDFPEKFSKTIFCYIVTSWRVTADDNCKGSRGINRWQADASRHDIMENLLSSLMKIFGKSWNSWYNIAKSGRNLEKNPGYPLCHRLIFGNSSQDSPIWIKQREKGIQER